MPSSDQSPDHQVIALLNAGSLDEAAALLLCWLQRARDTRDISAAARACEHLANLRLLQRNPAGSIPLLNAALRLRQAAGDWPGVAGLSWSLGMLSYRIGDIATARRSLIRAVALADELGLPQSHRYRAQLQSI